MTPPANASERYWDAPASFAQERMWFVEKFKPGTAVHNIAVPRRLGRRSSRPVIERCLAALVRRHESLRTALVSEAGIPLRRITARARAPLAFADLRAFPAGKREARLAQAMENEARRPFDLAQGPLFRATLYRVGAADDRLLIVIHHAIADAWSLDTLLSEFAILYQGYEAGRSPDLPPMLLHYADWAAWQRSRDRAVDLAYWQEALRDTPAIFDLPTDRPRPPVATQRGATRHFAIPSDLAAAAARLATAAGTSAFAVYQAAYTLLLARRGGVSDLLIGCPMPMRQGAETQAIVGLFLNTLPLRMRFDDDPTVEMLLRRFQQGAVDAQAHVGIPLEDLINLVRPERTLERHPLFQVLFSYEAGNTGERPGSVQARLQPATPPPDTGTAKFDLCLLVAQRDSSVAGAWEYATDLFDPATIARMEAQYLQLLRWMSDNPHMRIADAVLSDAREVAEIERFECTPSVEAAGAATLIERVLHQAADTPDAVALIHGTQSLDYRALAKRVNALAGALRAAGAGPDKRVGILMPRSIDMVVAVLATLCAGAAYLPLDPAWPEERIGYVADDGGVRLAIATHALGERLPPGITVLHADVRGDVAPPTFYSAQQAAYVLYTSGSTGRPKGVVVLHVAVCAFLDWAVRCFGPAERRRVFAATALSFDLSVFELFLPLTTGGTAVMADSVLALAESDAPEVTLVNTVPSALREVLQRWRPNPALRAINLAGEALPADLAADVHARFGAGVALRNLYGPTETTIYSTGGVVSPGSVWPTIGRPIDGTEVRVLDDRLCRVAVGVAGELHIAGPRLARGYCGDPGRTAERYRPDPYGVLGARLYRTGDLVRWLPSGELEFLGRYDGQIKLRGHRIELEEIEATLREHPNASDATVVVDRSRGMPRLVAFVVGTASADELAAHVRRRLPGYMMPDQIDMLVTLPRTTSGKIDRKALVPASSPGISPEAESAPPVTDDRIAALCAIFSGVLGVAGIDLDDNFFEHGGHSLLVVRLLARIETRFGFELSIRRMFDAVTIRGFCDGLSEAARASDKIPRLQRKFDAIALDTRMGQ